MEQSWKTLFLLTFFCTFGLMTSAKAQIIPDNSLGAETSIVGQPNQAINGIPINQIDQINGGARRGGNLFHSFGEFNVNAGRATYFSNPDGVGNILTRVTGVNRSNILGTLGVLGNANLFLINPNGIFFGPNASLDVRGSFFGSSANSLLFDNGFEFSATNPQAPPLLTVNIPIGLRFRDNAIASQSGISQSNAVVNAGNLTVNPGQNLTLIGGIAINAGQLNAASGEVTLASVNSESIASLQPTGSLLSLEVVGDKQIGSDISLTPLLNIPGFTVNGNGGIEFAGVVVPNQAGTTIVTGSINTSSPTSRGGTVKILGNQVGLYSGALINASGNTGGGTVLVGGNYQGQGQLLNALASYVSPSATILANALTQGNGGKIVVWSDQSSRVYGTLQAKGGAEFGDGGLIETSSFKFLDVAAIAVDASASNGLPGTWLIDPRNVLLGSSNTSGSFSDGNPNVFTPNGDDAIVPIDNIQTQLSNGNNVIITTGNTGTQEGNITTNGFGLNTTNTIPVSLTLRAANNIELSSFSINGLLNIVLEADSDKSGQGNIRISSGGIQTRGGQFTATAPGLFSLNGAGINSTNASNQAAAPINITAANLTLEGAGITSTTVGAGKAGDVNITAQSIALLGSSGINSHIGNVDGQGTVSNTDGTGDGGNVTINTNTLLIQNRGGIGGTGRGSGKLGTVNVTANDIQLRNQGGISSNVEGNVNTGNAGDVNVSAKTIALDNSSIRSFTDSQGSGGNVTVNTNTLLVENTAFVGGRTRGGGQLGTVNITANAIKLRNQGGIGNNVRGSSGNAGTINVRTGSLEIENRSGLGSDVGADDNGNQDVSVQSTGNAGIINITADSIFITGTSGMGTKTFGSGSSGKVVINTGSLVLKDDSGISTETGIDRKSGAIATNNTGEGGSIEITANTIDLDNNSRIVSGTGGQGNAGEVTINTNSLLLRNGGNVSTSALPNIQGNAGRAGTIKINANSVTLENNGGINSETFSSGVGGNIELDVKGELLVSDRSTISVASNLTNSNTPGNAGDININARSLQLNNQSQVIAQSASGDGGNIRLKLKDILQLRGNSQISTSARGNGNGGNIRIDAPFIVAFPRNNDITANAGSGSGGQVRINASLFGINPLSAEDLRRLRPNDSDPRQLSTNDITAISRDNPSLNNNNVQVNSPDVDPSRGLVELPETVTDTTQKIAQSPCRQGFGNEFAVTGRGGLPTTPNETLSSNNVRVDLLQPVASSGNSRATIKPATTPIATRVPAQGWIFNDKGQVVLTAYDPTNTGSQRPFSTAAAACPAR